MALATLQRERQAEKLDRIRAAGKIPSFRGSIAADAAIVVLGILAFVFAPWTGLAAGSAFAVVYALNGAFDLVHAFQTRKEGRVAAKVLFGILSLVIGYVLFTEPVITATALSFAMTTLLIGGGMLELILGFQLKPMRQSRWITLNGVVLICLGAIALAGWPLNAPWLIGTFVGVALIVTGLTRLMAILALREELRTGRLVLR